MTDSDFGGPAFPKPDERPVCKLCGLEDGACICRSIPKQPQPDEVEAIAETIWRAEYRRATGRERSIPWSEASPIDQERYRYVAAAILAMQAERRGEQIELAYGLLWVVGSDRSTTHGNALYHARKALFERLDKAGQSRGISAARKLLDDDSATPGFFRNAPDPLDPAAAHPAPIAGLEPAAWRWRHGAGPWQLAEGEPIGPSTHLFDVQRLYTRAQLEAHAAEQVRPLVEALKATLEEIERVEADVEYSLSCGDKARAAIRARGQV